MSRPMIHCPDCHRELFNLHRPQCLWCGARLTQEQFQQVAEAPGAPGPPPPLPMSIMPPLMGTPWSGRSGWFSEGNPFALIKRSVSPWERKLRIVGAALCACLTLARLLYLLWDVWRMHQSLPPLPPIR